MLDYNVITAVLLMTAIVATIGILLPYLRKKNINNDIYADIKLGLMLFGYAFRDEKIKQLADKILTIVTSIEQLDIAPNDKKEKAVVEAFDSLLIEFSIPLDEVVIELLVNIAVAYLPPTHEGGI